MKAASVSWHRQVSSGKMITSSLLLSPLLPGMPTSAAAPVRLKVFLGTRGLGLLQMETVCLRGMDDVRALSL